MFGMKRMAGPMREALQRRMHGWFGGLRGRFGAGRPKDPSIKPEGHEDLRKEGEPGTGGRRMFKGGFGGLRRLRKDNDVRKQDGKQELPETE